MITSMSSLPIVVLRSKNAGASHRGEGGVPEEGRSLHAGTFEDWKSFPLFFSNQEAKERASSSDDQ